MVATGDLRDAAIGAVAGAMLGIVVGIHIEHRRNLGERQVEVVAEAPEGDENDHQTESPSHEQGEKTGDEVTAEAPKGEDDEVVDEVPAGKRRMSSIDLDTGLESPVVQGNVVFRFKNAAMRDEFKRAIATLSQRSQAALMSSIFAQDKPCKVELTLGSRKVSVDIVGLQKDAQAHVCTIKKVSIPEELAPSGNQKREELLARMGEGMQAPALIGHLRPAVHRLDWPNGNRLGLIFGGRNTPQDVRNCLPQNQAHCAYFDEALAFLAAVENQDISIDVPPLAPQLLTLSDGTQVAVATNSGAWAITLGPGQQPIRIAQELIRLYKILDVLEAFGNDQGKLTVISVHGNVKPLRGNEGVWEARLNQKDRILYRPQRDDSILIG
ncbi:MAG: hypothetical protein LBF25_01875 [Puniceicoccales bacterium]|jgi:hypothetical protein|nr:hypothetical protein [Puniceicoccales bacterium]